MQEELEEYILNHIDAEPEMMRQLNRDTHIYHLYSRMCSGHLQGRMLKMFTRMIRPQRILELGAFTGYSALCFAEGMPEDAELHTVEIDDEIEDFILERFNASPYADRMHLHIGDAMEIVPTIDGEFDLVFIDPPYSMECCVEAAMRLRDAELIIPGAILVLESGSEAVAEDDERLRGFEFVKSTSYGKKTAVNILIYRGSEA